MVRFAIRKPRLSIILSVIVAGLLIISIIFAYHSLFASPSLTGFNSTYTTVEYATTTTRFGLVGLLNQLYCTISGFPEYLDVWLPAHFIIGVSPPAPAVLYVHGGAWINNSRAGMSLALDEPWKLIQAGFIVASSDYYMPSGRTPPMPGFPANIEDIMCAVRFLRANAASYGIDPNHIGILGFSAGAHLVSLEGLAASSPNDPFQNVGQWQGVSSQVQAVADSCCGPANLTDPSFYANGGIRCFGEYCINLVNYVFNGTADPSNLIAASPVTYITSKAPPFLIEQGENDSLVPMIQSVQLYNDLINHGDKAQLILVQNATHLFIPYPAGATVYPNDTALASDVISFFQANL